jgi:hypothetical protein
LTAVATHSRPLQSVAPGVVEGTLQVTPGVQNFLGCVTSFPGSVRLVILLRATAGLLGHPPAVRCAQRASGEVAG